MVETLTSDPGLISLLVKRLLKDRTGASSLGGAPERNRERQRSRPFFFCLTLASKRVVIHLNVSVLAEYHLKFIPFLGRVAAQERVSAGQHPHLNHHNRNYKHDQNRNFDENDRHASHNEYFGIWSQDPVFKLGQGLGRKPTVKFPSLAEIR